MRQRSWAWAQRVWKRQPVGGLSGLGTSPASRMRARWAVGIGHRHGRQQRLGVGMARLGEQAALGRQLDDLAEIHDGDPVGDVAHHGEVVGDEEVGEAELVLAGPAAG